MIDQKHYLVLCKRLYKDLRMRDRKLIEINFNGYAMGGLAVGEKQLDMFKI